MTDVRKKMLKGILLFICFILPWGMTAQEFLFEPGNDASWQEPTELIHVPFGSEHENKLAEEPVLYGPGGDPIGGLPAGNGHLFLLGGVIAYALVKVRKKVKNLNSNF